MSGDKPFEATQSRIDKAKREGNVARSAELGALVAFFGGITGSALVARPIAGLAAQAIREAALQRSNTLTLWELLAWASLPASCAAAAGIAISFAQAGGIRFSAIGANVARMNPSEGLKRMLSREAVATVARASAELVCATVLVLIAIPHFYSPRLGELGVGPLGALASQGALRIVLSVCAVGSAFAVMDYWIQRGHWKKKLRMSSDELKRDHKEQEGDPLARGRRRALHRRVSHGSMDRVRDAAFVVTNPTHIAIALEYAPPRVCVPTVLVRAADEAAVRVRDLAREHGVPLVENVSLARALFASSEPGDAVPKALYFAVAEIVAALKPVEVSDG
ncbi:MAG: EscU/YscU/HrcU family type III secretion system export apparatus switch protein [Candidatus Eremiobacteraeota bacterium]|nr:EscU/YscU/HrcU family type III secretion system export apparatus switch protein [Candidatus Eremiobacteraeota bacterium]